MSQGPVSPAQWARPGVILLAVLSCVLAAAGLVLVRFGTRARWKAGTGLGFALLAAGGGVLLVFTAGDWPLTVPAGIVTAVFQRAALKTGRGAGR